MSDYTAADVASEHELEVECSCEDRRLLEQARAVAVRLEAELAEVRSLLGQVFITFADEYDDRGSGRILPGSQEAVAALQRFRATGSFDPEMVAEANDEPPF